MKTNRLKHAIVSTVIAAVMLATPLTVCTVDNDIQRLGNAGQTVTELFATDVVFAATSSSKAKQIATKDAKSRYKISKSYSVKASSGTYKGNKIYKVTFYGKKSSDKYYFTYYVSKSSGKILYRKQSI